MIIDEIQQYRELREAEISIEVKKRLLNQSVHARQLGPVMDYRDLDQLFRSGSQGPVDRYIAQSLAIDSMLRNLIQSSSDQLGEIVEETIYRVEQSRQIDTEDIGSFMVKASFWENYGVDRGETTMRFGFLHSRGTSPHFPLSNRYENIVTTTRGDIESDLKPVFPTSQLLETASSYELVQEVCEQVDIPSVPVNLERVTELRKAMDNARAALEQEGSEQAGFPIEEMRLSSSTKSKLKFRGISTLADLAKLSREDLLDIPGIGPVKVDGIERALRLYIDK